MSRIRFLDAGESHGPELTVIVEGLPAGLAVDAAALQAELDRRRRGFGASGRMRIEEDRARITAGVMAGKTTGSPVALRIENADHAHWAERDVPPMSVPRPGHADLVGALKYGHADLRLALERASARETAARVAGGALCKMLLAAFGIRIAGYAVRIGQLALALEGSPDPAAYVARAEAALGNDLAWPEPASYERARAEVRSAMERRDTLGGVLEVAALGLPPGLGSYVHWDRRLDGTIAQAMLSIQAMKGVEIGLGFAAAALPGSRAHDEIVRDAEGHLLRETNRAGGTEGGVTNGEPLWVRVAMKPLATTLAPRRSVDLVSGAPAETSYERSDVRALARAVPIAEAMLAFVLADSLTEKLGGDSLAEMRPRFESLARARLADLRLEGRPWRFGYEAPRP